MIPESYLGTDPMLMEDHGEWPVEFTRLWACYEIFGAYKMWCLYKIAACVKF